MQQKNEMDFYITNFERWKETTFFDDEDWNQLQCKYYDKNNLQKFH